MEILLVYIAGTIAVGILAGTRDRSVALWMALSLALSPLLSGLIVLFLGQAKPGDATFR